jgi:acyl-CoA synthetase (NDP forming)
MHGKHVTGNRVAALSNAGFEAVGMADSIRGRRFELRLRPFADDTTLALQAILREHRLDGLVDVKNPFDITPMANEAAYAALVGSILDDPAVDAAVVGIVPLTPALQTLPGGVVERESVLDPGSVCQLLPQVVGARDKAVVAVVDSGAIFDPMEAALEAGGIPVFRSADRAIKALRRWIGVRLDETSPSGRHAS